MKIRFHTMAGSMHSWPFSIQAIARAMKKIGGHEIHIKSTNDLEYFPDDLKDLLLPGYHGTFFKNPEDQTEKSPADYWDGQKIITVNPNNPLPEIPDNNLYDLEFSYTVFLQHPRRYMPQSRARANIWNFESSILPPGWNYYHQPVDYILPSSQFSYDIFANNGIPKDKMLVVPHGVDADRFNPNIPPYQLKTKKKIKFLHNAIPHHRKLHERVIKAYLDTFTGDDDVCLVMKTKFLTPDPKKPFEVDVRQLLTEAFKGRENPPEIEIVNSFVPNIGSLYTACDAVVSMSSTEGFCLLPDTLIDTNKGLVKIKDVNINDAVYTYTGKEKSVLEVKKHFIKENLIKIRRQGSDIYFAGTENHPHLIVQRKEKKFSALRKMIDNGEIEARWVGLKDIKKDDLCVISKPKFSFKSTDRINVKDFISGENFVEDDGHVWLKNSYKKEKNKISMTQISGIVGCSFQYVSDVINNKNIKNTELNEKIRSILLRENYSKPNPIKINKIIKLNKEICKFFGLYIAEGSISSNGKSFNINLHKDEIYGQNIVRNFCSQFSIPFCEMGRGDNGYQISGSSKIISSILSGLFGENAFNKKIPDEFLNSQYLKYIIHGIFYGDGTATNKTYSFSTSSLKLCYNLFQTLLANGIFVNILTDKREKDNYCISVAKSFNSKFCEFINPIKYNKKIILNNSNKNNSIIEGKEYFLCPIVSIESEYYEGEVFNLEVNEDNSYSSFGMITHNCLPLLEALACNKLIIAPRHGGQLDFLNDENSLLVDTGEMKAPVSMQYWAYNPDAIVGDPSIKHFSELMRRAYENIEAEKARIIESAKKTVEKFTWERAAQMILDLPIPKQSKRIYNRRRVLYIIPYDMLGGGEVWVRENIKKLDKNIYEPHVVCLNTTPKHEEMFGSISKCTGLQRVDIGQELRCFIESGDFALVHFYNSFGVYNILKSTWDQGWRCRIVETVHSDLNWPDSMMKVAKRDPIVAMIMAVSKTMANKLGKFGNKNVAYLPQPIDWDKFKGERNKEALKELNIPDRFTVGYVGRISAEKNLATFIRCSQNLPEINFVVTGNKEELEQVLNTKLNNLNNLYFTGYRKDVERFYSAFDALMLPSIMEGLPLVILEAMSMGTPVIASNVGAIPEVVVEGKTGFLMKNPNDVMSCIKAIQQLQDKEMWNKISNNCREQIELYKQNKFDINYFYNLLFRE